MFLNGKRIKIKIDGDKRVGIVTQHHIHVEPTGVPGAMYPGPMSERIEIELDPKPAPKPARTVADRMNALVKISGDEDGDLSLFCTVCDEYLDRHKSELGLTVSWWPRHSTLETLTAAAAAHLRAHEDGCE